MSQSLNSVESRRALLWWIALVTLWTLLSLLFSAYEVSITADERIYQYAGFEYLKNAAFKINYEHPPLSKWTGALIPYFFHKEGLFWYRLFHIFLFLGTGLGVFTYFYRKKLFSAAFVWSLLFFFCPNFKALSSLHVQDSDVALYTVLASLFFYEFTLTKNPKCRLWLLGLCTLVLNFTILTKFTGLFLVPFFGLGCVWAYKKDLFKKRELLVVLSVSAFAFLVAYLFYPKEILWYGKGIDFQKLHNRAATHATSFFGEISAKGFWNYYLLSFLFKSTFLQLVLCLGGLWIAIKKFKVFKREVFIFLIPSIFLFVYLSRLNVQLGFRYALPATGLLFLFVSLVWGQQGSRWDIFFGKTLFIFGIGATVLLADAQILWKQDYLSYFNSLAPSPTRNFADGNNDWGQKLPQRLAKKYPGLLDIDDVNLEEVLKNIKARPETLKEKIMLAVGASDLAGLFRPEGYYFRARRPVDVRGAFEIHELTWEEYLRILLANDLHERPRFTNPTPEQMEEVAKLRLCDYQLKLSKDSTGQEKRQWLPFSESKPEFEPFPCF